MAIPLLTISGRVVGAPQWRPSANGMPIVHLKLKAVDRRQGDDGKWFDGDEYEVHAQAFKDLAENIRDSIHDGDLVVCSGRLRTERWKDAQDRPRVADKFILSDCGPSLKLARRRHEHVVRAEVQAEMARDQ